MTGLPNHPLTFIAPEVEFPVTICVAAFGPHADLSKRFLESLYRHTDPALFFLRAGLNEVELATRELFESYASVHGNVTLFVEPKNRFKSPLMRRLFYEYPLHTEWTIWCDDDTHFTRADWLHRLARRIARDPHVSTWGDMRKVTLRPEDCDVLNWIKAGTWYRNVSPRLGHDESGAEVVELIFPVGGFWAARSRMLRDLGWPDSRLLHAHEDFMFGEAMRQNGFALGPFTYGVVISDAVRRNPLAPEVRGLLASGKPE